MISCIAVDDEPLALSLLADNIGKVGFLELKATCDNALAANHVLQEGGIDLVFMDIQMPGMTGIQFIRSMVKKPVVIIVSAYKQYALDGFDLDVADYLVKPVLLERFIKACNKAKELIELKSAKRAPEAGTAGHIFVNTGYNLLKIVFSEVLYIEGLRDYVKIHFIDGRSPAVARLTFKNIGENWPSFFIRVHKSFIVNSKHVVSLSKTMLVAGEQELPIGEAYRQALIRLIENKG